MIILTVGRWKPKKRKTKEFRKYYPTGTRIIETRFVKKKY